jgi:RimJ/RimL family protein N-acetyltransferase
VLFAWRNDPDTRRKSISTTPLKWKDHMRWLERVLADPGTELFVAYRDREAVGTARLDFGKDARISVTVAPEHRGKGLAVPLIRAACTASRGRRVVAEIRADNSRSIRAFEHAGFQFDSHRGELLRYTLDPVKQAE